MVGVGNAASARRLGGVIKPAPDDGINPKTGEPNGIDKGWGYMPGDTVSDTVRTMAAQTRQWQYEIAKAYMQSIPPDVRDRLARAYRALPSTADDTRRYVRAETAGHPTAPYRTLGLVTTDQVKSIRALTGVDVSGYDYSIDSAGVKHIGEAHGSPAAKSTRGQRAVISEDYTALPQLIETGQIQRVGNSSMGLPQISIKGRVNDTIITTYWELRPRRKTLTLQTLWIGS